MVLTTAESRSPSARGGQETISARSGPTTDKPTEPVVSLSERKSARKTVRCSGLVPPPRMPHSAAIERAAAAAKVVAIDSRCTRRLSPAAHSAIYPVVRMATKVTANKPSMI